MMDIVAVIMRLIWLWHGVVTALPGWLTAQNPSSSQPDAFDYAVFLNSFGSKCRACGFITTLTRPVRRNCDFI